jgi:hypothetical protein
MRQIFSAERLMAYTSQLTKERRRGGYRKHFGPWEKCELKVRAAFGFLLTAMIFLGDLVQNPDLAAVIKAHGANYLICYAAIVGLQATILKYRDNSRKIG